MIPELAELSWPTLCKLAAHDPHSLSLVEALPHLKELNLYVDTVSEFMGLSDRLLTALCVVDINEVTGVFLTGLRTFPRPRMLSAVPSETLRRTHQDFLLRTLTFGSVNKDWDLLSRYGQLRWLNIERTTCPAPPTSAPLPHLKRVSVGVDTEDGRFEISTAFLLAHGVLTSQPHIQHLAVFTKQSEDLTEEATEEIALRTERLVAMALTRNLRTIAIDVDGESLPALLQLPAIKYGWLKVTLEV